MSEDTNTSGEALAGARGRVSGGGSLAAEVSHRMRHTARTGATFAEIGAIRAALTPEQLEAIGHKQRWEACSFLAVLKDWPQMFEPVAS